MTRSEPRTREERDCRRGRDGAAGFNHDEQSALGAGGRRQSGWAAGCRGPRRQSHGPLVVRHFRGCPWPPDRLPSAAHPSPAARGRPSNSKGAVGGMVWAACYGLRCVTQQNDPGHPARDWAVGIQARLPPPGRRWGSRDATGARWALPKTANANQAGQGGLLAGDTRSPHRCSHAGLAAVIVDLPHCHAQFSIPRLLALVSTSARFGSGSNPSFRRTHSAASSSSFRSGSWPRSGHPSMYHTSNIPIGVKIRTFLPNNVSIGVGLHAPRRADRGLILTPMPRPKGHPKGRPKGRPKGTRHPVAA